MNKGTLQFIVKGIILLILVYIILSAIYALDLERAPFFAAWNTAQLAVVGLIFLGITWSKLKTIKEFKWGVKSTAVFLVIAAIFLGLRYYFIDLAGRSIFTAIGFLALVPVIFSFWCTKTLLREYRKELIITAIIGAILAAVLYVANVQLYVRPFFGY